MEKGGKHFLIKILTKRVIATFLNQIVYRIFILSYTFLFFFFSPLVLTCCRMNEKFLMLTLTNNFRTFFTKHHPSCHRKAAFGESCFLWEG